MARLSGSGCLPGRISCGVEGRGLAGGRRNGWNEEGRGGVGRVEGKK